MLAAREWRRRHRGRPGLGRVDQHLQPVRGLGEVVKLQGDQLGALAHQRELEHQSDAVAQLDHLLCGVLLLPAGPLGALACR